MKLKPITSKLLAGFPASSLVFDSFSGTWDKIGKGSYGLMGLFSGVSEGVAFSGVTNQMFTLNFDDDRACLSRLNGTTTINVSTFRSRAV